ncbi:MAG: DUF3592 domain-containing protein [Oscillospiraceae bacterium]|nr:DUF3592 domain-containing protein [Oscillospiraceae bacterium]
MEKMIPYLALGVLSLICAVIIYKGYYFKKGIYKKCTSRISARVTDIGSARYRSVVYEATLEDGKTVTFSDPFTTKGLYVPEIGETVELFYDPNDHRRCSFPKRNGSVAMFCFVLGGAMFALPIFGMVMYTIS